jgi:hypothetical protein
VRRHNVSSRPPDRTATPKQEFAEFLERRERLPEIPGDSCLGAGGRRKSTSSSAGAALAVAMPGPHCATCAAYEERVMAKAPDEVLPPDVVPCKDYAMSDRFREWAVGEMRREVMSQVRTAGLDRMAIIKAKREERKAAKPWKQAGKDNPPTPAAEPDDGDA